MGLFVCLGVGAMPRRDLINTDTGRAVFETPLQCSRLQGRIALGEAVCANLDAIASDPLTPWAMREAISSAMEWHRTSQTIDELAYLLGYDDAQIDALFIEAMQITV